MLTSGRWRSCEGHRAAPPVSITNWKSKRGREWGQHPAVRPSEVDGGSHGKEHPTSSPAASSGLHRTFHWLLPSGFPRQADQTRVPIFHPPISQAHPDSVTFFAPKKGREAQGWGCSGTESGCSRRAAGGIRVLLEGGGWGGIRVLPEGGGEGVALRVRPLRGTDT